MFNLNNIRRRLQYLKCACYNNYSGFTLQVRCNTAYWGFGIGFVILLLYIPLIGYAQHQIVHRAPISVIAESDLTLSFTIIGISPQSVQDATIFYNVDGELTSRRVLASFDGYSFKATIPGETIRGATLYYYIIVDSPTGARVAFPSARADIEPVRVPIILSNDMGSDAPSIGTVSDIDFEILSPQPGSNMSANDALIAISFFYTNETANANNFRLYVNGLDVTTQADVSEYLITYFNTNLPYGQNTAELIYKLDKGHISITQFAFNIVDPASRLARIAMGESTFNGDVDLTVRNQVNAGNNYDFLRGSVNIRGREGEFRYSLNGLLTSQESDRLQPQNRYGVHLSYKEVARLEVGHVYPTINPLLMAGRRTYGVHAEAKFFNKNINLQVIAGQLNRRVESLYDDIKVSITSETTGSGATFQDTTYSMGMLPGGGGTFQQDIMGGRVSFGNAKYIQIGINALQVRDNVGSIDYFNKYNTTTMQRFDRNLTVNERNYLSENPEILNVSRATSSPIDNLVAATDIFLRLNKSRITVNADAAVSLLNNDISEGYLSVERADELGLELGQDIANLFDMLSFLIIINERMNSLPLRFVDDGAELFIPGGIFAYQGRANFNYVNNMLGIQYRWIGPDFVSLANNGIRRDIAGITLTDRFRLLDNTVYVNLLYENLNDNLRGQLNSTTNTNTYGTTVSWFPLKRRLPRVTLGVRYTNRSNEIDWSPFVTVDEKSNAVRNLERQVVSGDTVYTSLGTPRDQNTYQLNGSITRTFDLSDLSLEANINAFYSITKDIRFAYGDFNNISLSTGVNAQLFDLPLRASFNLNYNTSEAQSGLSTVNLFGGNLSFYLTLFDNMLVLNLEGAISSNDIESRFLEIAPYLTADGDSFDIYVPGETVSEQRSTAYIGSGSVTYRPVTAHQFSLSGSFTNVVTKQLIGVIPNDHFAQFRYTYFF